MPFPDAAEPLPESYPMDAIDDLSLYIIIGDSVAAGRNASSGNEEGGRAFARLVYSNHPAFPAYASHNLRSLYPGSEFVSVAESGATSDEALSNLRSALDRGLPASVPGDVLVSINVGGNGFNSDMLTIINAGATGAVTSRLRANLAQMFSLLRERYDDPGAGKNVVFLVDDVQDPTDDTGSIPAGFDDDLCGTLNHPLFVPSLRELAITNLGTVNAGIAEEVAAQDAHLVTLHDGFIGHGMNGVSERWLDDDCVHPNDAGHHALRRMVWETLTGEVY